MRRASQDTEPHAADLESAFARIRRIFNERDGQESSSPAGLMASASDADWYAQLHVTSNHLHEVFEPTELTTRLRELLINIVGAATFQVFVCPSADRELVMIADEKPLGGEANAPGQPCQTTRDVALSGQSRYAPENVDSGTEPVAVVPISQGKRVLGVIRVIRLLPHKGALESRDRELLEHIGASAGYALVAAGARQALANELGSERRADRVAIDAISQASSVVRGTR